MYMKKSSGGDPFYIGVALRRINHKHDLELIELLKRRSL